MRRSYKSLAKLLSSVLVDFYISRIREVCLRLLKRPGSARGRAVLAQAWGSGKSAVGTPCFTEKETET